jgi:hypothetical protein
MAISGKADTVIQDRPAVAALPSEGHSFAFLVNQVAEVDAIARTDRGGKPRVTKSRLILAR